MAPLAAGGGPDSPLTTTRRLADRIAADTAEARKVEEHLSGLLQSTGLIRYEPEKRRSLGITNSAVQLKKSLASLQLLKRRPELLTYLKRATREQWTEIVALRIALCEARRVLRPTLVGAENGEIVLLGEITATCDHIEDQVATRLQGSELSPKDRRLLEARFVDPARLSQLIEESATARQARRARRSAVAQKELSARKKRLALILGRDRLAAGPLPVQ